MSSPIPDAYTHSLLMSCHARVAIITHIHDQILTNTSKRMPIIPFVVSIVSISAHADPVTVAKVLSRGRRNARAMIIIK